MLVYYFAHYDHYCVRAGEYISLWSETPLHRMQDPATPNR